MKHPGKITFVDGDRTRVEDASQMPDSHRFAEDRQGKLVPVVRVVAYTEEERRIIREYGADGAVLRSTVAPRTPPK
jgi:hypothetical protein